jgi:hypothetical protein
MPKQISVKNSVGPALLSGGIFFQGFGEFQRVNTVVMGHDLGVVLDSGIGALSGFTISAGASIQSGNQVRVKVEKRPTHHSGGAVTVAASGDVISNTFSFIAYGT